MIDNNYIIDIFFNNNKIKKTCLTDKWLNLHPDIKNYLDNIYRDSSSLLEKLYRIKNNITKKPVCKCGCGQYVSFMNIAKGYRTFATCKCALNTISVREKYKQTLLNNYGVDVPSKNSDIKKKIKNTCIEKYGCEVPLKSDIVKEKMYENNLLKYGVKHVMLIQGVQDKYKQTCLLKYGVDNVFKNTDILEKYKLTCIEKYGVDNVFKNTDILEKYKQTCLEKYGVDNISKCTEIVLKITNKKKENNTFNKSKQEDYIYNVLCLKFNNVIRLYKSELYPFNCDFYIPEKDLYIECNFHWTHGGHIFNEHNENDIDKLNIWKEKSLTSIFYKNAINVWVNRDIEKINTASENNLNYIVLYNVNDIKEISI